MSTLIDSVLSLLILAGSLLLFAAGLGLLRGADPIGRIRSVAKAGSVGALLLLLSTAIAAGDFAVFMRALAAGALILVNTALMSQILAESADRDRDQEKSPPLS